MVALYTDDHTISYNLAFNTFNILIDLAGAGVNAYLYVPMTLYTFI